MRSDQAAVLKGLLDLPWRHADLQSLVLASSVLTRQRPGLVWQHKGGMTSFTSAAEEQTANPTSSIKARDKLLLAGLNGCLLCGVKSIRKVYWEFSIRCCRDCLIEHSLAENTLKHTFKLQPSPFNTFHIVRSRCTSANSNKSRSKKLRDRNAKDLLQEWCRQYSIDLSQADRYRRTYNRNCHLAVPLMRKAYEQLLPCITES
ncbi:hypothetical protein WJX77_005966 [Trebouxia sp. C0004]